MIELPTLIAALSSVLPSHVRMTKRPDPVYPQDILLEWRPKTKGASILDIGWEADGGDIQIGFGSRYFDLYPPKKGAPDSRLEDILEYAEAISLGRLVTFSETEGNGRVETTVFGCRSGPRFYRAHGRATGEPDIYLPYAPW